MATVALAKPPVRTGGGAAVAIKPLWWEVDPLETSVLSSSGEEDMVIDY